MSGVAYPTVQKLADRLGLRLDDVAVPLLELRAGVGQARRP